MMGDRPPKSMKLEANFIPEKKSPQGTKKVYQLAEATARVQASETEAMGEDSDPLYIARSKH